MVVERLVARVWVQDPGEEVARIRRELDGGDDTWRRWLEELERGDAVVASMHVTAYARLSDGTRCRADAENHHLWLELGAHPPLLEAQVQEVVGKDCGPLAQRLREFGELITADALSDMYVHVELGDDIVAAMPAPGRHEPAHRPEAREAPGTERGRDAIQ